MAQKRSANLLTDEEYAKVFDTFSKDSSRNSNIENGIIRPLLSKFADKSIDIMSIGAGTGWIEDKIIKHPTSRVNSLLAVEPNPEHADEQREKSKNWTDTVTDIDITFFDENYATAKKFDVILMVHFIYYVKKPH